MWQLHLKTLPKGEKMLSFIEQGKAQHICADLLGEIGHFYGRLKQD